MEIVQLLLLLVLVGVGVYIYMLPTVLAERKDFKHTTVVALLNLFCGATLVVWVLLLIWVINAPPNSDTTT